MVTGVGWGGESIQIQVGCSVWQQLTKDGSGQDLFHTCSPENLLSGNDRLQPHYEFNPA